MFSLVLTCYESLRFCAAEVAKFEQNDGVEQLARSQRGVYSTQLRGPKQPVSEERPCMAVMHFFNKKMKHGKNKTEGKRLVFTVMTSTSSCFCMLLPQVVNALKKGFCLPPSGEVFLHQMVKYCRPLK